ncbi:NAD-dependent epimerase/dehydratase family protein [Thermosulfuriphilus sp.]
MILITGALGFVGHNLILKLLEKGRDFWATDIWPQEKATEQIKAEFPYEELDIIRLDDLERIFSRLRPEFVIHLSAHSLPASLKEPITNAQVNIVGSLNLLEVARRYQVKRIIFASASSVVGTVLKNPVSEDHPCSPKTPYGVAKYATEHYLRVFREIYGLDYLAFRLFNVYGPYQRPESGALVPVVMDRVARGQEVFVFGDGSAARDFIFVDDVIDFFLKALELSNPPYRLLNLGTGRLTSVSEIIQKIGQVVGRRPKVVRKDPRPGEIANFSADVTRLGQVFGEVPAKELGYGLEKTYEWLKREVLGG